ncbi:MAG: class I SAM-dependent methyltransferase [Chloroflexi bacterium]|nr:class I SAM-dependent methyltransferase [Chloroflexota bacterium]
MPTLKFTDPQHLRADQYRDSSNLDARITLHERFSINPYGWQRWVYDQLEVPPNGRILEIGCGPGNLWQENQDRLREDWIFVLSDLSSGMLQKAKSNLQTSQYQFCAADIQNLPFPADNFDVVIANHMLYHIPDRVQALGEIHRVIKPGSLLYAATNGDTHLQELDQLIHQIDPYLIQNNWTSGFSLENGAQQLQELFHNVELSLFQDGLVVNEIEPLVAYIASMNFTSDQKLSADQRNALSEYINDVLAKDGLIHITKSPGMFIAEKG